MDEEALRRWHTAVNTHDTAQALQVVTDPVVVNGPGGTGRISATQFADWIERSGISMTPCTWHPVSDRVSVVEQHASWPQNSTGSDVATCFVTSSGRVSAALRYPSAREALQIASLLTEVLATEASTGPSTTTAEPGGTNRDTRA